MLRRIVVSVVLVVVVMAAGIGVYRYLEATRPRPERLDPQRPVLSVSAVRLTPTTVVVPLEGFGTARADRLAVIGAEVGGRIVALPETLRPGVAVLADEVLLRIDPRDYEAQLARARGARDATAALVAQLDIEERNQRLLIETAREELAVAEREYNRVRDLLEDEVSNPRELDIAGLEVQRARRTLHALENELALIPERRAQQQALQMQREAEVQLAAFSLERCTLRAPFAGRVDTLHVEIGEQVQPGQPLLAILDPTRMEVALELPVSYWANVQAEAPVRLWLESSQQTVWHGTVARIAPSADERLRTFALYVEVYNPKQAVPLMPGMFVRAQIDGPTLHDVLLVPRGAVREEQVFVCRDGRAQARRVAVGQTLLEHCVIGGLAPGEVVITSNLDVLYDGAPVEPILVAGGDASELPAPALTASAASSASESESCQTP